MWHSLAHVLIEFILSIWYSILSQPFINADVHVERISFSPVVCERFPARSEAKSCSVVSDPTLILAAISNPCCGGGGSGVGHPLDATIFVNSLNIFKCKIHHLFPLLGVSDLIGLTHHLRIWAGASLPLSTTNITKLSSADASGRFSQQL